MGPSHTVCMLHKAIFCSRNSQFDIYCTAGSTYYLPLVGMMIIIVFLCGFSCSRHMLITLNALSCQRLNIGIGMFRSNVCNEVYCMTSVWNCDNHRVVMVPAF